MLDTNLLVFSLTRFYSHIKNSIPDVSKRAFIAILATSGHERNTPRTCTPENANQATTVDNSPTYIADLAINPETGIAEPINVQPILPQDEDIEKIRENMQQLLDIIIGFFEVETQKVESGVLKEEEMLINVQELDTDTKRPTRLPPKNPYQRRAEDLAHNHETDTRLGGQRTKCRKTRDRISHRQFVEKTGLSRRIITQTIPSLLQKGLIAITDLSGKSLISGRERTGRTHMFYSSTCAFSDTNLGTFRINLDKKVAITKLTIQN